MAALEPGNLIVWKDAQFGFHRVWVVESCLSGALGQESLIRICPLNEKPGFDENGNQQHSTLVPEVLLRDLTMYKRVGP